MSQRFKELTEQALCPPKSLKPATLVTKVQFMKQNILIYGFIRNTKLIGFNDICQVLTMYSRFPDLCPEIDPANFVTNDEIIKGNIYRLKGNYLFQQKQYESALIKYKTSIKFNPNDYRTHCNKSLCHMLLNQLLMAYKASWTAIRLFPTERKCWFRLGTAALKLNDIKSAFIAFRTFTKMDMNNSDININNKYYNYVRKKMDENESDKQWIQDFYLQTDNNSLSKLFTKQMLDNLHSLLLNKKQITRIYHGYIAFCLEFYQLTIWSQAIKYHINPSLIYKTKQHNSWIISYTSSFMNVDCQHNKRSFILDIICLEKPGMTMFYALLAKPNAKHVIDGILRTVTQHLYRPKCIQIAYRLRYEAATIINTMSKYGIQCFLEYEFQAQSSAQKHGTDPNGYNYCTNRDDYLSWRRLQNCGNKRCHVIRNKRKFRMCSGCQGVYYCSKKCQKYDWNYIHRFYCF